MKTIDITKLLSIDELLEALKHKFTKSAVYHWVQQGCPVQRIRRRLYFDLSEVMLWLERQS